MKPVFEYLDYRDLLREAYEDRKSRLPLYSYRMMAEALELNGSYLFRVLQKDLHLPVRCVPRALDLLELSGRQAEYFQLLLSYARERKGTARNEILDKALALRDVVRSELAGSDLAFFRHWWVGAVRCVLETMDGRVVPAEIAKRIQPSISVEQVNEAIALLLELGLVKKADSGRLVPAQPHLTASGEKRRTAVAEYQEQILELARDSIVRFPRENRDISTLSVALDESAFVEVRSMLREFRRQIQKRVEEAPRPDRVMQLAMAFFPLSTGPKP